MFRPLIFLWACVIQTLLFNNVNIIFICIFRNENIKMKFSEWITRGAKKSMNPEIVRGSGDKKITLLLVWRDA